MTATVTVLPKNLVALFAGATPERRPIIWHLASP